MMRYYRKRDESEMRGNALAACSRRMLPLMHLLLWVLSVSLLNSGCVSAPEGPADEPFSIIVLPDTQFYADVRDKSTHDRDQMPDQSFCFYAQTKWIKKMRRELNIAMVAHVGDIVQHDDPREWEIADDAFRTLDHTVPYILSQGNHDMGCETGHGTARSRFTRMDDYFPPSRFESNPLYDYGGNLGNSSVNSYLRFTAGGMHFLILSLEFKPRDEAIEWANSIIAAHPGHRCIIVTHAYLTKKGALYKKIGYDVEGNSAEAIWQKLVSQHENIFMVLCGHTYPNARLTSRGVHGNEVHQVLSDFQNDKGGQGYLRIMTFIPRENRIDVSSYSPVLERSRTEANNRFSLEYPMSVTEAESSAGRNDSPAPD